MHQQDHNTHIKTGSKGEKTRTDIIVCATRLFYEQGYEGTSFSHIVSSSGLYRGNIYHYFKSKDDILQAVIHHHLETYKTLIEQWNTEYPEPKSRLLAFISMIHGSKLELIKHGCPIGSLNTELAKTEHTPTQPARVLFDLFLHWLTECFMALHYSNEAKSLAMHLLGRAQGIALIAHTYQDTQFLSRELSQLEAWIKQL